MNEGTKAAKTLHRAFRARPSLRRCPVLHTREDALSDQGNECAAGLSWFWPRRRRLPPVFRLIECLNNEPFKGCDAIFVIG